MHMVVSPALKGGAWVIRVMAVELDHLVQNTAGATQVFVAEMVSQHEEYLSRSADVATSTEGGTHKLDAIAILVVTRDVGAVSNQDVATLCQSPNVSRAHSDGTSAGWITHCLRQSRGHK